MKKGFTLIELLAVIVILAVISLIAIPIITNMISDARGTSKELNTKFYLDTIKKDALSSEVIGKIVPDGTYAIMADGNICIGQLLNNECSDWVLKIAVDGEKPIGGKVEIKDSEVINISNIKYNNYYANLNSNNEIVISSNIVDNYICNPVTNDTKTFGNVPTGLYSLGDEYICKVKENTSHHFFVVSNNNYVISMVMTENLTNDLIEYISSADYIESSSDSQAWGSYGNSNKGPITLLNYIYNNTKEWQVPNVDFNSVDTTTGLGITTSNNKTTITGLDGIVTATYDNLKARILLQSEISSLSKENYDVCGREPGSCKDWLGSNLNDSTNNYWTISEFNPSLVIYNDNGIAASLLNSYGYYPASKLGVRVVIEVPTIKIG